MKKGIGLILTGLMFFQSDLVKAQKDQEEDVSEIIIRQNGAQEKKITVTIDGDNVIINGKPLNDFNEDGINIRRRKMLINEGEPLRFSGRGMINGRRFEINGDNLDMHGMRQGPQKRMIIKQDSITFLGVQTEYIPSEGAKVTEVVTGSAAEAAGLKAGDLILSIDKSPIDGPEQLSNMVRARKPNEKVEIAYKRDGKKKKTNAVLQSKVISTRTILEENRNEEDEEMEDQRQGIKKGFELDMDQVFSDLDKQLKDMNIDLAVFPKKQKLGLKIQDTEMEKGVLVLDVSENSLAANSGILKDDVITGIDGQSISNTDEARAKIHELEGKSSYGIRLLRKNKEMQIEIKTPKPLKTTNL
jgi:serine protease Do